MAAVTNTAVLIIHYITPLLQIIAPILILMIINMLSCIAAVLCCNKKEDSILLGTAHPSKEKPSVRFPVNLLSNVPEIVVYVPMFHYRKVSPPRHRVEHLPQKPKSTESPFVELVCLDGSCVESHLPL